MKHEVNFPKRSLIFGECQCCHKRCDHIVIGDGRCTDCIYDGIRDDPKIGKFERDYILSAFNIIIGMVMTVFAMKALGHPVPEDIPLVILWILGLLCFGGLVIHIYNFIKKS